MDNMGIPVGILSGLRNISPNLQAISKQNEIEIVIPKEDIINAIRQGMPENVRNAIVVEYTDRGVVMRVRLL